MWNESDEDGSDGAFTDRLVDEVGFESEVWLVAQGRGLVWIRCWLAGLGDLGLDLNGGENITAEGKGGAVGGVVGGERERRRRGGEYGFEERLILVMIDGEEEVDHSEGMGRGGVGSVGSGLNKVSVFMFFNN
ncbi:hypothetical protein Droror1_Dr00026317 [Drosera rotundifolia]